MAETETRIALLEQGRTQIVSELNEVKQDLKEIKSLLINNLVTQKDFQDYKASIREEIQGYKRSQFWQKVMTGIGSVGMAALILIIGYELTKLIDK